LNELCSDVTNSLSCLAGCLAGVWLAGWLAGVGLAFSGDANAMLPGCCFAFYAGWLVDAFAAAANIALLAAMAAACCLSELIG
jgi:hypothetical protein